MARSPCAQLDLFPQTVFRRCRQRHNHRVNRLVHYDSVQCRECRRAEAFIQADFRCEAPGCRQPPTQTHHADYEHFGNELPSDLRVFCRRHKEQATEERKAA